MFEEGAYLLVASGVPMLLVRSSVRVVRIEQCVEANARRSLNVVGFFDRIFFSVHTLLAVDAQMVRNM